MENNSIFSRPQLSFLLHFPRKSQKIQEYSSFSGTGSASIETFPAPQVQIFKSLHSSPVVHLHFAYCICIFLLAYFDSFGIMGLLLKIEANMAPSSCHYDLKWISM